MTRSSKEIHGTIEWRKLAKLSANSTPIQLRAGKRETTVDLAEALRAACTRLDQQANLLGIANKKWDQALARSKELEAERDKAEAELAAIHAEKRQDMIDGLRGKMGLATLLHKTEAELASVTAEAGVMREALDTYAQYHENGEVALVAGALAKRALSSTSAGAGLLQRLEASEAVAEAAKKYVAEWRPGAVSHGRALTAAVEAWKSARGEA